MRVCDDFIVDASTSPSVDDAKAHLRICQSCRTAVRKKLESPQSVEGLWASVLQKSPLKNFFLAGIKKLNESNEGGHPEDDDVVTSQMAYCLIVGQYCAQGAMARQRKSKPPVAYRPLNRGNGAGHQSTCMK